LLDCPLVNTWLLGVSAAVWPAAVVMVAVELTPAVPKASALANVPLVRLTAPVLGLASPYMRLWLAACTLIGRREMVITPSV
jgi:hypothetical protein